MNTVITFILSIFANIYKIHSSWFWELVAIVLMALVLLLLGYGLKKYTKKRNVKQATGVMKFLHRIAKILLTCLFGIFILGTLLHISLVGYIVTKGGKLEDYSFNVKDVENTASNVKILTERGEEIYTITNKNKNREYVTKEEIPQILKDAVVATEDKTYYKHSGVSVKGYLRAIYYKLINPEQGMHGGSTITQQLIKNINEDMYGRTIVHKYQEALVAIVVENKYSKEEILEMYLNNIFLGSSENGNLYGVQSASKYYFNKEVSELSISESAYIAGLAKAPSTYTTQLDQGNERKNVVLSLMAEYGAITQNQKLKEKEEIISLIKKSNANNKKYSAYADYTMHEIEKKFGMTKEEVFKNGYTIRTYLDKDMQTNMYDTVQKATFKDDNKGEEIVQVGMAAVNNDTRKIVAVYGGRNYEYGYQNRSYSKYQPGSILKPLAVYGPAFDSGKWTAYSKLTDEETDFGGYKPKNSNGKFVGETTVEKALISSLNIPAVKVLDDIGLDYGINTLSNVGIKVEEKDKALHIALGGMEKGVSPIEMAQAYSTFANFGYYEEANAVKAIEDENGAIIKKEEQIAKQKSDVFKPETAYNLTEIMEKVITDSKGTGGNADIKRPIAGKTGTAQEPLIEDGSGNRAAWFVGYTPEFTVSVYTGFDKPSVENTLTYSGGDVPAKLFGTIMTKQMADYLYQDFQKPATVNSIYEVNLLNGAENLKTKYNEEEGRVELTWETKDQVSNITYKIYSKDENGDYIQIGKTSELFYYDHSINKENKKHKEIEGDWTEIAKGLWDNTKITYENVVGEVKAYYVIAEYNGVESEKTKTEKKWIR